MKVDRSSEFDGEAYGFVIAGHFNENDTYITRRPNGMSDWLITYTIGGEGYFITPRQETICRAGDVTLLKSGVPHQYGTGKGQTWHFVWAHFSPQWMEPALLPGDEVFLQSVTGESTRKRIYRAFRRILSDSRERGDYWHELCMDALREILMLVAQKKRQTYDDRIEETLHLLSRHMKDPLRIEQLARTVGLSPSRLSHLFKENTGQSIVDALNQMRVRQAALLLQHTERSASEVALDVGFNNYNHFINQFRKRFGVNPSTFKKKMREQ